MSILRRLRGEAGFTIIETMAATLIMAIAFLGFAGVHTLSSRAQSLGNNQGLATFIANEQIELMRRSTFADVTSDVDSVEAEGVDFTVVRLVTNSDLSKRVGVIVFWSSRLGMRVVTQTSMVSLVTNP
ncbi:MAG: hypothetical protein P8R42_03415 [Candidatus Binatia bacterium]|nr:hypothetical protein [Candidatus Binatia bacterium]